jgi:hypothetical protein
MRDGTVYAHPTLERATSVSVSSSLLGTPTAQTGGDHPEAGHELLGPQVRRLHTPTTGDTHPSYDTRISPGQKPRSIPVPNLAAQVEEQLLQTPGASAAGYTSRSGDRKDEKLLAGQSKELLPSPGAWLGRRPENSMSDPERARSRQHEGKRGKRSLELPDAIASIGDHTPPPSNDGNE